MARFFQSTALLVAGLIFVYSTEQVVAHFFGDQTLAPLLSVLCCVAFIFVGSPNLILAAIPLFALLTYLLIMDSSKYPLIRTTTMVMGGALAYWSCRQRNGLAQQIAEVEMILSKIQEPWVLCDRSGNIRRISSSAVQLAGANLKDVEGTSFFSIFSSGPSKGELIQKFLQAADSRFSVEKYSLAPPNRPGVFFEASLTPLQLAEGFRILIIIPPPKKSFK